MTDHRTIDQEVGPPKPSAMVLWLYGHGGELKSIRVDYVMLTEDTSKTVWHVEFFGGHKQTVDQSDELSECLDFYPSSKVPRWRALASLKEPLRNMCEAREKWEKAHAREFAEYRRLKEKFG